MTDKPMSPNISPSDDREALARFPDENPNPVFRVSRDGLVEYANRAAAPVLKAFECGRNCNVPPGWKQIIDAAFRENESRHIDLIFGERAYSIIFSPIDGKDYLYAYGVDITDRKHSETSLREGRDRLARAQKIARTGDWERNLRTGAVKWSDEIYRILGLDKENDAPSFEAFIGFVHPSDRERLLALQQASLATKTSGSMEFRMNFPEASRKIVRGEWQVQTDESGEPECLAGTLQDITDRKLSENRFELAGRIFENTLEGVMILDSNRKIVSINPAFTAITGYAEEEAVGFSTKILYSDQHSAEFFDSIWTEVETDGGWRGEIWSRRKDGGAYPELRSITTVRDEFGDITHYVVIFYDLTKVKRSEELEEELIYKAGHDPLTDLPNRTLFYDRLNRDIARSKRNGTSLAVMLVGIDAFKQVNETLGHTVGDTLLKLASERIQRSNRAMDTVARFGGDEFGVIFENIEGAENAGKAARKIMNAFAAPFILDEGEIFLTISMGVALYPNDDSTVEVLIKNCDTAMHRAKDAGKNSCEFFRPEMTEKAMKRHTIERELRLAVAREEFVPYFQPKVNLKTGEMTGMETLVRWRHPLLGIVPPNDFIPIAEETGLVTDIGGLMLKEACRLNQQWMNAGYPPLRVAVNLSARQFQRGNIVEEVEKALAESSLDAGCLELEITESMVMKDVEKAIRTLQSLHDMGIVLSVDDFGTGYSSLGYLKRFPLDALKIDVIFIRDMITSEEDQGIVAAIISMAHNLKLKVIAEGVETAAHIEFLKELGCDEIQGYYYSKPLPREDFEELLKKGRILKPAG